MRERAIGYTDTPRLFGLSRDGRPHWPPMLATPSCARLFRYAQYADGIINLQNEVHTMADNAEKQAA